MGAGSKFREILANNGLVEAMAAHSPLSAMLAAEAGFDAIWASGFELSAMYGVPDVSVVSMTQHLDMTRAIAERSGIPVVAHIGFTPQSVNGLGGFRVQGRGDAAEQTVHDAIAVDEAGAIAVVLEMVPAELATQITGKLTIPTIGIGAGPNCDAQVLVWQDMAGRTSGRTAKFVKRFADIGGELGRAATQYAREVATGAFPAEEHSF